MDFFNREVIFYIYKTLCLLNITNYQNTYRAFHYQFLLHICNFYSTSTYTHLLEYDCNSGFRVSAKAMKTDGTERAETRESSKG